MTDTMPTRELDRPAVPAVVRHLDQPAQVEYRTSAGWRTVNALAVRRLEECYTVLIAVPVPGGDDYHVWVDRDSIRVDNPPSHR